MSGIAGSAMRVLIVCQGHPSLNRGGNEIAAFELFTQMNARPDCEAWFLGCAGGGGGGVELRGRITQPFTEREYIYAPSVADWFGFTNRDPLFPAEFSALIEELAPDVVHFHGFGNVGVEAFAIARRAAPTASILLTLHEYAAICAHHGQMVKRPSRALCEAASLRACSQCYPEHGPTGFFVRDTYIRACFEHVDRFIAPSAFLRQRFIEWGIASERITHVPNVIAPGSGPTEPREADGLLRVGFFGKVTPMKGIGLLIDAARLLHEGGNQAVRIDIHGTLEGQPDDMRAETEQALRRLPPNVHVNGPYDPADVDALMRRVDAVVVPSIWWENAPVVIEEARRNGRAVICADIGGMAEAIHNGVDGFHFKAGDPAALAQLMGGLSALPYQLSELRLDGQINSGVTGHLAHYDIARSDHI